jgi:hypothetical protein
MYGIAAPQLSNPLTSFANPSLFSLCLTGIVTLPLPTMNPPCQVPARLYANKSNYDDNVGVGDDDDDEKDGDDDDNIYVMMIGCSQAHQQMDSIPL